MSFDEEKIDELQQFAKFVKIPPPPPPPPPLNYYAVRYAHYVVQ